MPARQQLGNPGRRHSPHSPGGSAAARPLRAVSPVLNTTHIRSRRARAGADGARWNHSGSARAPGRARARSARAGLPHPLCSAPGRRVRGAGGGLCRAPFIPSLPVSDAQRCPALLVWADMETPSVTPPHLSTPTASLNPKDEPLLIADSLGCGNDSQAAGPALEKLLWRMKEGKNRRLQAPEILGVLRAMLGALSWSGGMF